MTTATLDDVLHEATRLAAENAAASDREHCARVPDTLARFAEIGALALGVDREGDDISPFATLLRAVAGECLSTAFSLWAHRMVIEYLRDSDAPAARVWVDDLVAARRVGSIAMATALQELAGLGSVPTIARPDGTGGYIASGRIAWASNVGPGTLVLFPARVANETADPDRGERVLLVATVGDEGFTTCPVEDLLALGSTQSSMLVFENVAVPSTHVIAQSLDACRTQRGTHLLLQTAFCLGLADRSLLEAATKTEGPNRVLVGEFERLRGQKDALSRRFDALTSDPIERQRGDITLLRYEAARLATAASRLEVTLTGGRGYVTTSDANRRLREAAFLPVQSPSEVHLLWELENLGVPVAAAAGI